jgi:hypothetical protein
MRPLSGGDIENQGTSRMQLSEVRTWWAVQAENSVRKGPEVERLFVQGKAEVARTQ